MTNEYQTMIEYIKDTTENKEALDAVAPRKKEAVKNRFFFRFSIRTTQLGESVTVTRPHLPLNVLYIR
mgnify:CR=1 FL=1